MFQPTFPPKREQRQRIQSDLIPANEKTASWVNDIVSWGLKFQPNLFFLINNPTDRNGEPNILANEATEALGAILESHGIKDLAFQRQGQDTISADERAEFEAWKAQQASQAAPTASDEPAF